MTEPYHPNYFLINGRSMPDNMDANYAPNYPNQPYNANPHMHPGELVLVRYIGQGHWQHPFHEHGNHVHILGRDSHMMVSQTNPQRAPFCWLDAWNSTRTRLPARRLRESSTGRARASAGISLGHTNSSSVAGAVTPCVPDANGYYTINSPVVAGIPPASIPTYDSTGTMISGTPNYYEWCADHNVPLEANPVGAVGGGGPMTLPDPLIVTNGLWYNGTPYLGPDAVLRSRGPTPLPPGSALQNPSGGVRYRVHVALPQRARDHHQRRFPGRHADDDAGGPLRLEHRRNAVSARRKEPCDPTI